MAARLAGWLDQRVPLKLLIAGAGVFGLTVLVVLLIGGVSVAADKPDGWIARNLLHFVFKRSIAARAGGVTPPDDLAAPSRVRLAAQHFDMVCANCHGRPGYGQSIVALSMNPRPQYLPKVLDQFTDRELYLIVEHGVHYSAMPAWPTEERGDEVWSMVAFLRQLQKLDAKSYREMTALPQLNGATPAGGAQDGTQDATLRPAEAERDTPPVDEFLYAAPATGFADETVHQSPVATCARCHGADGSGAATGGEAPNLTIQEPAYLQAALDAYTRGARKSGYMENIASELTSAQVAALARYYAGLPVRKTASPPADPALLARGEAIAFEGVPQTAVPACSTCHESAGARISGAPHLAGQSSVFLTRQLTAMRQGGRGASNWWNPMPAVAHNLSPHDIAAVAAYYASLTPAKAAPGGPAAPKPPSPVAPITPDPQAGMATAKVIFQTQCLKCHVNQGRGDLKGDYPNLTLQTTPFVAQTLHAFYTGARPSDQMRQTTGGLSFDDMASLARYVNSLTPQPAVAKVDPAAAARGAAIALHGAPARGIPACLSCHGAAGVADLPLIPRLQGQSAPYLRARLDSFAEPYAKNLSALNPMPLMAGKLTEKERADLAAYFAALAPLPKTAAPPSPAPAIRSAGR
jgi:cytochrome c553